MDEEFFRELFRKPAEMEYSYHPSERVLRAYLNGALGDEWHFDREFLTELRQADLNGDWGLSEVSLHLLTCSRCCAHVAQLREEEVVSLEREARAERGLLARLWARVSDWLGLSREVQLTWPGEWPVGVSALGFLPVALDLPLGIVGLSPVNLSLFHQRLHSGL